MKAKAIISAVLLMVCTIASAQTEKKYYMNVQTAPEEVQSYEVNSDLKVSWEQTQKGATPSGYYSKNEVDAMLRGIDEKLQANHYTLEMKLEMIEKTLNDHKMKFEEHEGIFRQHEKKLAENEKNLDEHEKKLAELEKKLVELESRLQALEANK